MQRRRRPAACPTQAGEVSPARLTYSDSSAAITPARKLLKVFVTLRVTKPHHAERDEYFLVCRANIGVAFFPLRKCRNRFPSSRLAARR
jgi:hypothetical protein